MALPLVDQLRFARSEFVRGLGDVSEEDGCRRVAQMNCISWMVGHLAWQEQRYWLKAAQDLLPYPELLESHANGKPATTPPLGATWAIWRGVTAAADPWLDALTAEQLEQPLVPGRGSIGTFMLRTIYHYWYHLGEGLAVRQVLGQANLPDFVGNIDDEAPYRRG